MIALTLKHLQHHVWALLAGAVLLGSTVFTGWILVLSEQMPSLMSAATGVLYYLGPLYILFVHERLIASDHADGTAEFLAALPLGTATRLLVPFVIGAVAIAMVFEILLLGTAVLATRREGVPLGWFLTLHVQVGLYAMAWHCLAYGVAHLGRYRWLVWWGFFAVVAGLDGGWIERPFRTVFWHAILADPTEQARSIPPWDAIPQTLIWSLFGLLLAGALATWRGGSLVQRWYSPSTGRERGGLIVMGLLFVVLSTAIEESAPEDDTWAGLAAMPASHARVKVAGSARLETVGAEVGQLLDGLGDELGVDQWPPIVLHPTRRGLHRHVRRAAGGDDQSLVLLVDPNGPRELLVRSILSEVLVRQTGDLSPRIPGVDALVDGVAGWIAPSPALDRRYAIAMQSADPDDPRVSGRDLAEAVAVTRLQQLEASAGRPAVIAALKPALQTTRGSGLPAWWSLQWSYRGDWALRLTGAELPPLPPVASDLTAPTLPPVQIATDRSAWVAHLDWPAPQGAVLERLALDPLEPWPAPGATPRLENAGGKERVALAMDTEQPVAARLVLYWPPIEGWLSTPWAMP